LFWVTIPLNIITTPHSAEKIIAFIRVNIALQERVL
jgi:hypothetical protein